MACEEQSRLLRDYHLAVTEWSRVTEKLNDRPHFFIERAMELRELAVKAKSAYYEHKAEHGC
jgi:hypothetical protein